MAKYEANFNLDTLYYVAKEMDSYTARQEYTTSRIENETRNVENQTHDAVVSVENRLEEEKRELHNIRVRLHDAEWHLNNCTATDEEGNTTSEYEYWCRVVSSLEEEESAQELVVHRVQEALDEVRRLAEDANSRATQIRSRTQAYRSKCIGIGNTAASAIRYCADGMLDYWNLNL